MIEKEKGGNSVVVPVIKRIANNIAEALKYDLGKEEIYINKNDNKNILIYVNMKSRFEGESFIKAYVDNDNEAKQLALETEISIIEDEEYLKLVKKDVSKRFYSLYKSK